VQVKRSDLFPPNLEMYWSQSIIILGSMRTSIGRLFIYHRMTTVQTKDNNYAQLCATTCGALSFDRKFCRCWLIYLDECNFLKNNPIALFVIMVNSRAYIAPSSNVRLIFFTPALYLISDRRTKHASVAACTQSRRENPLKQMFRSGTIDTSNTLSSRV
jgi:hypothetical protein